MNECLAGRIDDADMHGSGMQIDAAIEWMLLLVESHQGLRGSCERWNPPERVGYTYKPHREPMGSLSIGNARR